MANTKICKIAIVGGGPSGVYMAMHLSRIHGDKVCLFEKEEKLGGRINDIKVNPESQNGPVIGIGARRVTEHQMVMHRLARYLNVTLQKPTDQDTTFLFARGLYSFNKDDFCPLYPALCTLKGIVIAA